MAPVAMTRGRWRWALAACLALGMTGPAAAQQLPGPAPEGILILNQDRLFSSSIYGQRVQSELEAAGEALAAENRQIEAQLTEEELQLTSDRANLPPEEFRALADEFDTRVGEIRTAQEAKAQALAAQADAARQRFFEAAFPILLDLMRERGAAVLLDNRSVLLSAETVDITQMALDRVNAEIGDGGDGPLVGPETLPPPERRPDSAEPDDAAPDETDP